VWVGEKGRERGGEIDKKLNEREVRKNGKI
jgi:hypothetical protein